MGRAVRGSVRQVELNELVHLVGTVDLAAVEVRLEVVELIWVGLLGQDGRAVVVGEGVPDGVGVVREVEHEGVVLLRVRPVES